MGPARQRSMAAHVVGAGVVTGLALAGGPAGWVVAGLALAGGPAGWLVLLLGGSALIVSAAKRSTSTALQDEMEEDGVDERLHEANLRDIETRRHSWDRDSHIEVSRSETRIRTH